MRFYRGEYENPEDIDLNWGLGKMVNDKPKESIKMVQNKKEKVESTKIEKRLEKIEKKIETLGKKLTSHMGKEKKKSEVSKKDARQR